MIRIVTTHYRYKRPPRKRKAVALDVPAIVSKGTRLPEPAQIEDRKSAIVTAKHPHRRRLPDVPEMTPEEHKRRGDAADELFREMKRQIAVSKR